MCGSTHRKSQYFQAKAKQPTQFECSVWIQNEHKLNLSKVQVGPKLDIN